MIDLKQRHYHVLTYGRNFEIANAVYSTPVEAAIEFVKLGNQLFDDGHMVPAEEIYHVLDSLKEGYTIGTSEYRYLTIGCSGGCMSGNWN